MEFNKNYILVAFKKGHFFMLKVNTKNIYKNNCISKNILNSDIFINKIQKNMAK